MKTIKAVGYSYCLILGTVPPARAAHSHYPQSALVLAAGNKRAPLSASYVIYWFLYIYASTFIVRAKPLGTGVAQAKPLL